MDFIGIERDPIRKIEGLRPDSFVIIDFDKDLVPQEDIDKIFQLQVEIEKTLDGMNYYEYAKRLWRMYFGDGISAEGKIYDVFESNLIVGLHNIDMRTLIYVGVLNSMPGMISKLQDKVKGVILWSKGDVNFSGYQNAKIRSSRINMKFIRALYGVNGRDQKKSRNFIYNKVEYMVENDKIGALRNFLMGRRSEGEEKIKLVVVEDSLSAFDKVARIALEVFGEGNFTLVSIWAAYSRAGENAKKDGSYEGLSVGNHNTITDFAELAGDEWADDMDDAYLLVDFDGVVCDNVRMRRAQSQVIYNAILVAKKKMDVS